MSEKKARCHILFGDNGLTVAMLPRLQREIAAYNTELAKRDYFSEAAAGRFISDQLDNCKQQISAASQNW